MEIKSTIKDKNNNILHELSGDTVQDLKRDGFIYDDGKIETSGNTNTKKSVYIAKDYIGSVVSATVPEGQPIYPDDYQKVEYIECDGNQYIETDFKLNVAFTINCNFMHTVDVAGTTQYCLYGIQDDNDNKIYNAVSYPSSMMGYTNKLTINNVAAAIFNKVYPNVKFSYLCMPSISALKNLDDQTQQSKTIEPSFPMLSNSLCVMGLNDGTNKFKGRIYDFTILEYKLPTPSVKLINLVPCYVKKTGELGMYDEIGGKFYTNAGTGTFTKGADI